MKLFNDEKVSEYWTMTLNKLEDGNVDAKTLYEVLSDMCVFFDFEYSFTYHMNHDQVLFLDNYYRPPSGSSKTPETISLEAELGGSLYALFCSGKLLSCSEATRQMPLDQKLLQLFQTNTLLLLPILDEHKQLIGLLGMGDRRRKRRCGDLNQQLVFSILVLVANHVKLQINRRRIDQTEEALSTVLDNMGVDIYVNDFETHEVLYVNEPMAAPYGGREVMVGNKCFETLYENQNQECDFCPRPHLLDEAGNSVERYSWDYNRERDGAWFRVISGVIDWSEGRKAQLVSSVDITEDKEMEEAIRRIAERDPLTGLANRRKFMEDARNLIADGDEFYLIFFDLMKFKGINDQYGHRMGDAVLKAIGDVLTQQQSPDCTCYRYGGDEFIVLLRDRSKAAAAKIGKALEKRAKQTWMVKGQPLSLGFSIGIAKYPDDGQTPEAMIKAADEAMYRSKRQQGGLYIYNGGKIASLDWLTNLLS